MKATLDLKKYWSNKKLGGGPITQNYLSFDEHEVRSPMKDYILKEITLRQKTFTTKTSIFKKLPQGVTKE